MHRSGLAVALALTWAAAAIAAGEPYEARIQRQMTKAAWLEGMRSYLPDAFCKPDTYFRQCFVITATECTQTASRETQLCITKMKDEFPALFNQPEDGTKWGAKVGTCAGAAFDTKMKDKSKAATKPECKDPANWVPQTVK